MLIAQVNLAVKVNYFDCGGVAICVTFRHVIADGSAAAHFVRNWSKVAAANCADGAISKDAIFDRTSIFPSQDDVPVINKGKPDANDHEHVTKWFVFENSNLAVLQEKIGNRSTRFEALLALMWGAIIDAEEESKNKSNPTQCGVLIAVNLRRKLNPPLHDQSIGNAIAIGMTAWPTKERAKYDKIVSKSRRVKDEFSVECDDYGVTFIEAHVGCNISELIKQPKMELLELLRPYNEEEILIAQVNLAVKVNHFDCGGVAICVTFRHVIADGSAAAHFVRNWSKLRLLIVLMEQYLKMPSLIEPLSSLLKMTSQR
ncbi:hypothetical protein LWI28_009690 [Acer negundo]|uniref:Uncharacterized protein n=1 Tax=Acer negundo TaxID=4023 RepID=A0AAD5JJL8_ACENE|nr:hypothetical protein LWI28_009690 [Acer negundo]